MRVGNSSRRFRLATPAREMDPLIAAFTSPITRGLTGPCLVCSAWTDRFIDSATGFVVHSSTATKCNR